MDVWPPTSYHVFSWVPSQQPAKVLHSADHTVNVINFASLAVTLAGNEKRGLYSSGFQ